MTSANTRPITAESIGKLDPQSRRKAFTALSGVLAASFKDKVGAYKELEDDEKKREWLAAFIIDPNSGSQWNVFNTAFDSSDDTKLVARQFIETVLQDEALQARSADVVWKIIKGAFWPVGKSTATTTTTTKEIGTATPAAAASSAT